MHPNEGAAEPPDSPRWADEDDVPTRDCPRCGAEMWYDQDRSGWPCQESGCDGFIPDRDEREYEPDMDEFGDR